MSNLMVNIRVGRWRLQIVRFGDWRGEFHMGRSPVRLYRYPRIG